MQEEHLNWTRIRRVLVMMLALALVGSLWLAIDTESASAHGSGTIETCEQGTDCVSATFAVCDPDVPEYQCQSQFTDYGPRDVTIQVSNFPANTDLYLWWVKGAYPGGTDCSTPLGRTEIATVTTDSTGEASHDTALPPGDFQSDWVYGPNWVCGTTSTTPDDDQGTVGDRMFTIYTVF